MKIATWNVNSLRVRLEHLGRYLGSDEAPDVLCMQETKVTDDKFPAEELRAMGYAHLAWHGQKTYNGVAIASKLPLESVQANFADGVDDGQARLIAATVSGVRVICAYVPMGTAPGTEKFQYKLGWLARLRGELNRLDPSALVALCGDLNITRGDLDTWDPFRTEGQILCHPHERYALGKVMDWGLVDVAREREPEARAFTWWDYRAGAWPRNQGFRIDYVLASRPLAAACVGTAVHKEPRGWEKASDHTPVSATFRLG